MKRRSLDIARYLFVLAALLAALYVVAGIPLRTAREAWMRGDHPDALRTLDAWRPLRLRPAESDLLAAAILLSRGENDAALPLLRNASDFRFIPLAEISPDDVVRHLSRTGRWEALATFLHHTGSAGSPDFAIFAAASHLAAGDVQRARTELDRYLAGRPPDSRSSALKEAMREAMTGTTRVIFDREGNAIASWHAGRAELIATDDAFASLIEGHDRPATFASVLGSRAPFTRMHTTLDASIQRAALQGLGGLEGAVVIIDARRNELLAAASASRQVDAGNVAMTRLYEPASTYKVVTALAFLDRNDEEFFEVDCRGYLDFGNERFLDWARHGEVHDLDDAMASSCNVAFGAAGARLGPEVMRDVMSKGRLGESVDLPPFELQLGRDVGVVRSDWETASYAVGLEFVRATPLQLALIASTVARGGEVSVPTLLSRSVTILGDDSTIRSSTPPVQLARSGSAGRVRRAMEAVVESPRGTGRRIAVDDRVIAMKTGTAGNRSGKGYDSIVIAIVPWRGTELAISIVAESAGPAEYTGAIVAGRLVDALASLE